jgi:succinate dehydrogenase / fumarate reductase iron-sulfur subunit
VSDQGLNLTLKIWRQEGANVRGRLVTYEVKDVSPDQSFLEMMDTLNERLVLEGKEPVAIDSDCREGICGSCGCVIDGRAHGPLPGTTVCQLHMRHFDDGATIVVEPWRARAFPVVKDLVVDRRALDRILMAGGYVSVRTGAAPDANAIPISKEKSDAAFDSAACKNASAMLFLSAKVTQLARLPQGQPERQSRALKMLMAHDMLGFGNCTNESECQAACPKEISVKNISMLNREFVKASITRE